MKERLSGTAKTHFSAPEKLFSAVSASILEAPKEQRVWINPKLGFRYTRNYGFIKTAKTHFSACEKLFSAVSASILEAPKEQRVWINPKLGFRETRN